MSDRTYIQNCIFAFILGTILILSVGIKFEEAHLWVLLLGGYIGMSLYVGWRVIRAMTIDSFKSGHVVGCLIIPALIPICIIGAFVIGMFACMPMFLRSLLRLMQR
jgi:hypothetical protein